MMNLGKKSGATFLPDDYVKRKADMRSGVVSVGLFGIVLFGVVAAFFVTNRQWQDVRHYQEAINVRYAQAAQDIETLRTLEKDREALTEKAELTMALIERVPRSLLLAELINRMPGQMTMLELEVQSDRQRVTTVSVEPKKAKRGKSLAKRGRGKNAEAEEEKPKPQAPRFKTEISITGVAPSHREVAAYVSSLQDCDLLKDVELKISELTRIRDREMNKFLIEARVSPSADARKIDPLVSNRDGVVGSPFEPRSLGGDKTPGMGDALRMMFGGKGEGG